jgi:predicted DNA-binding transcriptional regulator YafY
LEEVNRELIREDFDPVGKTTFFKDIVDIERVYKTTIEKYTGESKKVVYYRYEDPEFSIRTQPISENEVAQFKATIQILSRFKGLPQFDWVNEMIPMIETKLGLSSIQERNIISFEKNEDYSGLEHITPLFNAIMYKRPLSILYQDFKSLIEYEIEFHPYHLKQYNNRWYVFGKDVGREKIPVTNLALDRIKAIEEKNVEYYYQEIDWEDYFSDIIGVTRKDAPIEEIKLLIKDEEQAAYISTKPLHQSQKKIRKTELGLETSIRVIPNYELKKLLLSFGDRIEVLAPEYFRMELAKTSYLMNELYT